MASVDGALRVGILGTANIARKNARALKLSSRCELWGVASRDPARASQFAAEIGAPRWFGTYEELLRSPECEAIYLPLPTSLHLEWVRKCAEAKKHILLEKPCAVTLRDLDEMLAVCTANGVVLIDGLMFAHHARMGRLLRELQDPFTGPVLRVNSSFSFRGDASFLSSNIRVSETGDPLGALGDLGWYNTRLSLLAVNAKRLLSESTVEFAEESPLLMPARVTATCGQWAGAGGGVPIDCRCRLEWAGGHGEAIFDCSFTAAFRQTFVSLEEGCES
jgi:predicted dehydrogenase